MAITISKYPLGFYPAYNDCYIEFSSTLTGNNKAEIQLYPLTDFPLPFVIYPDSDGKYLFNLKESVKTFFNANGLRDTESIPSTGWGKSVNYMYLLQQVDITVYNDSTFETTTKNYSFFRGVKQFGELFHTNTNEVLQYSPDGVNTEFTYFEGFPFFFDVKYIDLTIDINVKVKNLNNGLTTTAMNAIQDGAFRVYIDKSDGENWTSENFLPLITGLNRCELLVNDAFKMNVNIFKVEKCEGVYLKWLNRGGSYSHYLFDRFYTDSTEGKEIGEILNNDFDNIDTASGKTISLGKTGSRELTVKAKYFERDYENLKDLINSPAVQLYTSEAANVAGEWIDVKISGSLTRSKKRNVNEITISIELPEVNTITL